MDISFMTNLFFALVMLIWATVQDIKDYTIPVLSIVFGMVAGLCSGLVEHGIHGFIESLLGGTVGLVLGYFMVRVVHMGEGDMLLYAALGIIFGPMAVIYIFALSLLLSCVTRIRSILREGRSKRIAFAPYILCGMVLVNLATILNMTNFITFS